MKMKKESLYEPMANATLMNISKKTAFLVAAACGRRMSDIQALSVSPEHLQFRHDGAQILPRASFMAKNQTMDFTQSSY